MLFRSKLDREELSTKIDEENQTIGALHFENNFLAERTKKLSDAKLDREELSTKIDEENQTIGALHFKNNFLAERTTKLEANCSRLELNWRGHVVLPYDILF